MSDQINWQWYSGFDAETFKLGPFNTRQEALEAAIEDRTGEEEDVDGVWRMKIYIVEAYSAPILLSDWVDIEEMLIDAEEKAYEDLAGETQDDPLFSYDKNQEKDLVIAIKNACNEWQKRHSLQFKTHYFTHERNNETVIVDCPLLDEEANQ